ncbi:MAG TPA: hypothetical protein VNP72_03740, partial [Longimicrobium sp.]|nr:hypothetical protein [Longimicrobium sp.]
ERINKKSAVFDTEKLFWMNGQYLARKRTEEVLELVAPLLVAEGLMTEDEVAGRRDWLLRLLDLLKVRARSTLEIPGLARPYLVESVEYEPEAVAKHWKDAAAVAAQLEGTARALAAVEPWEAAGLEAALRGHAESAGIGFGKVVHPLRLAVTGQANSPGIHDVLHVLGRETALRRIEQAREWLGGTAAYTNS